ncbi:MAG: ABC transporter permease [Erysipelotrichales bacterium]|nr:MAG: ABC transporter permease [Erysipelotrichales bacterium]
MNIFLFELKSNFKSTLIWIGVLCFVAWGFMAIYPSFLSGSAGIIEIFKRYPPEVMKALGFVPDQFFSVLGFYSFVLIYIELIAAMQAMVLGLGTSGREIRTRTSEFLLTKPIKRWEALGAKVLAILTILIITNLSLMLISFLSVNQVADRSFSVTALILVNISTFLLQLVFAAIGILLGVTFRKLRSVAPVSLSIVFGFFVVNMLKGIFDDAWIRYFSPFQFFEKYAIIADRSFETTFLVYSIALIIGLILFSFVYFSKKDIHAV